MTWGERLTRSHVPFGVKVAQPSTARIERKGVMGSSKRQTTMAKITRERKVQERREKKQEKKQAAREAKAAEAVPSAENVEDETENTE